MPTPRWTWAFTAYWAKNIQVSVFDKDLSWPGFGYSDDEEATIGELADRVSDGAYRVGLAINAILFIVLLLALLLGFGAIQDALAARGNKLTPVEGIAALAAILGFAIAVGFPLTVAIAGRLVVRTSVAPTPPPVRIRALARTILWQFARLGLLLALGSLVGIALLDRGSRSWPTVRRIVLLVAPPLGCISMYLFWARRRRD